MKQYILIISTILFSSYTLAQSGAVGINTAEPAATLDVMSSPNIANRIDGFIAPRLKGTELESKNNLYTNAQNAAIVYITEALTNTTDKTINVKSIGYYYFDITQGTNGRWVKLSDTTNNQEPWNIQNTTTPSFENTQNIYQKGTVAIKKINAMNGADLDVAGSIRGGSADSIAVVGQNSIAVGNGNIATNINSAAFGGGNTTNGQFSVVGGKDNIIGTGTINTSGFVTTVFGENNRVNHILSLVNGYGNDLTGADGQAGTNFVNGARNKILLNSSWNSVHGVENNLTGNTSFITGEKNIVSGGYFYTFTAGYNNKVSAPYASAIGILNTASGQNAFAIGKGTIASGELSFAGGGGISPEVSTASGRYSFAYGYAAIASGNSSVSFGTKNKSVGNDSFIAGNTGEANGSASASLGIMNKSHANYSVTLGGYNETGIVGTPTNSLYSIAMGARNKALADYAIAMGYYTEARGVSSTSMGSYTIAYDQVETAMGRYNTAKNSTATSERLLTVGNGNSSAKSDALMVLKNAKVGINISNFESTKADAQLQVNGSVKLGSSSTCNVDNEGTIRYDFVNKNFEGCNGTTWLKLNN